MAKKKKASETLGPIDYLVVMFPGNKFSGKIVPELNRLEKNGIIKVIDLIFILKDKKGRIEAVEARDLRGEAGKAYSAFSRNVKDWLSQDDVETVGASLPMNSSAAALLFENVWAVKFKNALLDADAKLITQGRIPHEQVIAVMNERIA